MACSLWPTRLLSARNDGLLTITNDLIPATRPIALLFLFLL